MKVVFEYNGERYIFKAPKGLMYINELLEETEIEGNCVCGMSPTTTFVVN